MREYFVHLVRHAASRVVYLAPLLATGSMDANVHSSQMQLTTQERPVYQRAHESVTWAMPMLDVMHMRSELVRRPSPEGSLVIMVWSKSKHR